MGNCLRPASSMNWGGEDWDSLKSKNKRRTNSSSKVFDEEGHGLMNMRKAEKEMLFGTLMKASCDANNGKVKIKISKKELVELLGGIEKQHQQKIKKQQGAGRVSAEQVLVRLMNARDHIHEHHHHDAHHRPWKPVLQSILEVN